MRHPERTLDRNTNRGRAKYRDKPEGSPGARVRLGILVGVSEQLDLTIVYEDGEDGWVIASIPEVSGVFSQGRTREEARVNVIEALRLMLSPEPSDQDDRREREPLHLTIGA